ncbi:hypothetical protein ABT120_33970 [Nonomuraea angiospora]|uniref:hypothetical protein n=1 Tax=Nonomuraea angiospora TaxID=46172 RepID=UPI00332C503A
MDALERAQRFIHEADPAEITRLLAVYLKRIDPKALTELPGPMRAEMPESIGFTRASFDTAIAFHRATGLQAPPHVREDRATPTADALAECPIEPFISHVHLIIQVRARLDRRVQIVAAPELRGVEIR